jgi:AcrR family transcriptional regulator
MPRKTRAPKPTRKPRADAQRNRERILEVALEAFTHSGATASLDEIARDAGVGPGTLYRHFPTRDALIEGVYRSAVERLADGARTLADSKPPVEALRAWMLTFVDHIAAKHLIAPALNAVAGGPAQLFANSRDQIGGAMDLLVTRAIASGDLRPDVQTGDLLRALIGTAYVAQGPDWAASARRLVEILINGSRA